MDDLHAWLADLVSGDEQRAEAAVAPLAALGERAWPALRLLLDSPEADHRWWALRTLAQNECPPMDWLRAALADPSPEVRQCAALGLVAHPESQSIPGLIAALADTDPLVAHLAQGALTALGAAAVPALLQALESAPQAARLRALRALAEITDPRAIPALMAALEQDSALAAYWAEHGLERLGLDMVYFKPQR